MVSSFPPWEARDHPIMGLCCLWGALCHPLELLYPLDPLCPLDPLYHPSYHPLNVLCPPLLLFSFHPFLGEDLWCPLEASKVGENPSIALGDMGVVQKVAAMVPNLEGELQAEQVADCMAVPMAALLEVEPFAPMEELNQNKQQ